MAAADPRVTTPAETRWMADQFYALGSIATFRLHDLDAGRSETSPGFAELHRLRHESTIASIEDYLQRCVRPRDRPAVREALEAAGARPGTDHAVDYGVLDEGDDEDAPRIHAVVRGFVAPDGTVVLGVVRPVAARRQPAAIPGDADDRLGTLTRLAVIGEVASGFCHELEQPLTALAHYAGAAARLALAPSTDPARLRAAHDGILAQVERATAALRRIRALSRAPHGEVVATDLNDSLAEIVPLLEAFATRHGVGLRFDADRSLPRLDVDPAAIQLAVINLVCNAVEASAAAATPGLVVELVTCRSDQGMEIRVIDRGIGLRDGVGRQVLLPFHDTVGEEFTLGLRVDESIAGQHAGRLSLIPNPEGGVTATLALPTGSRPHSAP